LRGKNLLFEQLPLQRPALKDGCSRLLKKAPRSRALDSRFRGNDEKRNVFPSRHPRESGDPGEGRLSQRTASEAAPQTGEPFPKRPTIDRPCPRPALKDGSNRKRTLKRPRTGSALQRACAASTGVYAGAESHLSAPKDIFSASNNSKSGFSVERIKRSPGPTASLSA